MISTVVFSCLVAFLARKRRWKEKILLMKIFSALIMLSILMPSNRNYLKTSLIAMSSQTGFSICVEIIKVCLNLCFQHFSIPPHFLWFLPSLITMRSETLAAFILNLRFCFSLSKAPRTFLIYYVTNICFISMVRAIPLRLTFMYSSRIIFRRTLKSFHFRNCASFISLWAWTTSCRLIFVKSYL